MAIRGRFILRYTGAGPTPHAHIAHLKNVPGTRVLDTSDKMLLVGHCKDGVQRRKR